MPHYQFYYDETEHSRVINQNTISAENFYDNFISVIVGWADSADDAMSIKYHSFEQAFAHRKSNGELKSTTLKQNHFRYGFASLNADNIEFIDSFLDLFDGVLLYTSVISKIEFLVRQIFDNIQNSLFVDADAVKYTITKALLTYKPDSVISSIYNSPQDAVTLLRSFFEQRIELNKKHMPLKEQENEAYRQVILLLDDAKEIKNVNWNYTVPFIGFQEFILEMDISDYSLVIDNEHKTFEAAKNIGIQNVSEGDSKDYIGIRIADMLAGIIAKLMKALSAALTPTPGDEIKRIILPVEWFKLNDQQLLLYKKLKKIFVDQNNCWYKVYAGNYADDLVVFIALLNYMDAFTDTLEIRQNIDKKSEQFNGYTCDCLLSHYRSISNKLPLDPVTRSEIEQGYIFNRQGAKVFLDINKQLPLPIREGGSKYFVLSVGISKDGIPVVTIDSASIPVCYRLPDELYEWALTVIAFSNKGDNLFPSEVVFTRRNNEYYADIL